MKMVPRQKIWLAVVVITNLLLWIIPSNVVELIARDHDTLLGRYSRTHFYWIIGVGLISIVSFYIDWSTGETYKKRWFQVCASLMIFLPMLAMVDFFSRSAATDHYVRDTIAYHRPVLASFAQTYEDRPEARRTYPNAPQGFGTVQCTLATDKRGFRNDTDLERYDVVVLGDSFAEGSKVSDDDAFPVKLARHSGLSVYNLGMSGYDPFHYLHALREFGLALKPRYVVCLIYEGNDFRSAKTDRKRLEPSFSTQFKDYMKRSQLFDGFDRFLVNTLGPVNANAAVEGVDLLDWLPLCLPPGENAKAYAFPPKQLRDLYESREQFAKDKHWLNPRRQLGDMNELCRQAGATLIVVFAPTKAHVALPLVADELPADKVRAFTKFKYKHDLPEAGTFLHNLVEHAEAREVVVGEWCRRESIPFVGLTDALRRAVLAGVQVYYTYDQHWSPDGHAVVADVLSKILKKDTLAQSGESSS